MYIVDENEVENIYNEINELIAYSFEGRTVIDPALDVGDKLIIDGKSVIYQGETDFQTRFIAEISSKISIKQKQETTVKIASQKVINRKVQSRIDEAEGKITQLVEETGEYDSRISLVEQDVRGIKQTVSSVEVKADNAQSVANTAQATADEAKNTAEATNGNLTTNYYTKTETNSQINQKATEITSTVSKTYSTKEETSIAKQDAINSANASTDEKLEDYSTTEEMNSAITQKADSITSSVNKKLQGSVTDKEQIGTLEVTQDNLIVFKSLSIQIRNEETINKNSLRLIIKNSEGTTKEYIINLGDVTYNFYGDDFNYDEVKIEKEDSNYKLTIIKQTKLNSHGIIIGDNPRTIYNKNIDIEFFEGNNYITLEDFSNSKLILTYGEEGYVNESELGTKIIQNWESVKIAWNQISQSIQLEGDDGNATMAFYDNNTKFAEMGVNTVNDDRYISFAIPCDYGNDIADGMAWGIQTTSDNKFWPILYIKNFHMAQKNAGDFSGELVLEACNLALEGINSAITCGNVKMTTAGVFGGIAYLDQETGSNLLSITPQTVLDDARIDILSNISFFANAGGTNSFKVGNSSTRYCLLEDTGGFTCYDASIDQIYVNSSAHFYCNLNVDGKVYADNISSDRKLKEDIEDSKVNALELIKRIKHRQFKMKKDGTHYDVGYIAQELEKIDKNFVMIREKTENTDERYYINELPIIATITKAMQEQQQQIENITKMLEVKNGE